MTELEFVNIIKSLGGRAFLVGGAVRDIFLKKKPKDRDYVITGVSEKDFIRYFPDSEKVGNSFPVYLVDIDGEMSEVAFARKERKISSGYHGFEVSFDPSITIEEDLFRRDTTMNSIALELPDYTIIDPFNGRKDIDDKVIRATSKYFLQDPVRALRAARQAAQHDFTIDKETYVMMYMCKEELANEPSERILLELDKAFKAARPSIFFTSLNKANILDVTFPEIFHLINIPSYSLKYKSKLDMFEYTMKVLDIVSSYTKDKVAKFCALSFGIESSIQNKRDKLQNIYFGYHTTGLMVLNNWDKRVILPKIWKKSASFIIEYHQIIPRLKDNESIVKLLLNLPKLTMSIQDFNYVIYGIHGFLPVYLEKAEYLIPELLKITGKDVPSNIKGKAVGDYLLKLRAERLNELL